MNASDVATALATVNALVPQVGATIAAIEAIAIVVKRLAGKSGVPIDDLTVELDRLRASKATLDAKLAELLAEIPTPDPPVQPNGPASDPRGD